MCKAKFLWETVATQGHREAQYRLGLWYRDQEGQRGEARALEWLSKAAENGSVRAEACLHYLKGYKLVEGAWDGRKPEWLKFFQVLDSDGNGALTPIEVGESFQDRFYKKFGARIGSLDVDQDSLVEINELADWWITRQSSFGDASSMFKLVQLDQISSKSEL